VRMTRLAAPFLFAWDLAWWLALEFLAAGER
jgi:hypothetical protein